MSETKVYIPESLTKEAIDARVVPAIEKLTASIQELTKVQEHTCPHCKKKFKC